ncbi:phospholipase D-like domain-containing protein [Tahibacter amnicola]|uniref:phospholipase D n=1 Tax=Tahibacter amnicola TaxID=2976241 RepID=A0ABY6BKS9_9GAMM|nr:phospholipase D-like domain-containing protein [Tahibacter amnicola]UXI70470.1 phospholipase D-like domain-containing protein [Tahibacter amnicola]
MEFHHLDELLRSSAADFRLATEEKVQLRAIGAQSDSEQIRRLRNAAFAIAREQITGQPAQSMAVLGWLEQVVKTLDVSAGIAAASHSAYFTPGDACLRKLRELCGRAKNQIDICVFTLADDRLSDEVLAAHRRGVAVRIITDNDKRLDHGSDIERLSQAGIAVRVDRGSAHMHHKFALFDTRWLANGSFNWTRSASFSNDENLVVSDDGYLVRCFGGQFEQLWQKYEP